MSAEKAILLLGRRDSPTDGVADYCENLREAGAARGIAFEIAQVPWAEKGWGEAVDELKRAAAEWHDCWVFLQYTTLAWSRRGFPLRAPRVLEVIRQSGARPAVVFHDFHPLHGSGIVGGIREYLQLRVLRQLYARLDLAIFTVPIEKIFWLPLRRGNASFIPVGANFPEGSVAADGGDPRVKTVAVYGITGGDGIAIETADISAALKQCSSALGPIRLLALGRGTREAEPALRAALAGAPVEIECLGLLAPVEVQRALARADVLLFVRSQISTRRGSAIAGIAAGLPIVCYSGAETSWPITEAGLLSVPQSDRDALAGALQTVLADEALRRSLAERSRHAYEKYFSWPAIAGRFAEELRLKDQIPEVHGATETNAIARV